MTQRLERKNGKIFGVMAGLSDYFGVDVTILRIAIVIIALIDSGCMVVPLYLAAALIMPKAWDYVGGGSSEPPVSPKEQQYSEG